MLAYGCLVPVPFIILNAAVGVLKQLGILVIVFICVDTVHVSTVYCQPTNKNEERKNKQIDNRLEFGAWKYWVWFHEHILKSAKWWFIDKSENLI